MNTTKPSILDRTIWKLTLLLVALYALAEPALAQTVVSGYTVAANTGTSSPAGLSADPGSGVLYFADTAGNLSRVATGGTVSLVKGAYFSPSFWPYIATEFEFYSGNVWVNVSNVIRRVNMANGTFVDVTGGCTGYESSATQRSGELYFSGGSTGTNVTYKFVPGTGLTTTWASTGFHVYSLEYDAVNDLIWARNAATGALVKFHGSTGANLGSVAASVGTYRFAIDPLGTAGYAFNGTTIQRVDLSTVAQSTFMTGVTNTSYNGLTFAPSTSGSAWNLYLQSGAAILEVKGFEPSPEIAIEQPAGTDLTDGSASVAFGTTGVAQMLTQIFTVKNKGSAPLNLGAITFDGSHPGDFTVTTAPGLRALPAYTGCTTFAVTFSPLQSGVCSAVMHVVNNDADENPFNIGLLDSHRFLSPARSRCQALAKTF